MKALVYRISPARWMLCKAASLLSDRAYVGPMSGLRLAEVPIPELPSPTWVRLKTLLGGICGTDLSLIMQRNHPATILQSYADFPAVLGHENVAIIDAVGREVSGWSPGQRVCADPALGCVGRGIDPPCTQCRAGRSSVCDHAGDDRFPPRALIGLNRRTGGSWSGYFLAHESQLHAVPNDVPDETAVLVDPIASAAHAVLRRRPREGESVLVNGSGIIGLGVTASIRASGHENAVTAVARHSFQAGLAERMGADRVLIHQRDMRKSQRYQIVADDIGGIRLDGRCGNQALIGGYDLIYECTGTRRGLTSALKWARSRGTVVAVGTTGISRIDTTPMWFDELQVIGANGRQIEDIGDRRMHTYDVVFEWLKSGRLDLSFLPVSRYRLADYRQALIDLVRRSRKPLVKAAFDPHLA